MYLAEKIVDCSINASNSNESKGEDYYQYKSIFGRFNLGGVRYETIKQQNRNEIVKELTNKILDSLNKRMINGEGKTILLKTMDEAFNDHLKNVDMLKKDISLGAFSDSNPTRYYEEKTTAMYNEMIDQILSDTVMEIIEKTPKAFQFGMFTVPTNPTKDL